MGLLMDKNESVGVLQKAASQSGEATEVETLARFNGS